MQSDFETEFEDLPCIHFFGHMQFSEEAHHIYEKVQVIEKITGCVTIYRSNLVHANFPQLKEIVHDENFCDLDYALRIIGNQKLKSITFHKDFSIQSDKVFISVNPLLEHNGTSVNDTIFDFSPTDGDCLQEQVLTKQQCKRIVGDVTYEDYLLGAFKRDPPVEIHGMLIFEDRDDINLLALENVTVIAHGTPAIVISNNANLVDISGLLSIKISGREPLLEISDNDKICAPIELRNKVKQLAQKDVLFDKSCLKSCEGGVVDHWFLQEFSNLKNCRVIIGNLMIMGLNDPDKAIEIFTYEDVSDWEKKRFKSIALKRDVFNIGHKPIKKERRIYETYENNTILGTCFFCFGKVSLLLEVVGYVTRHSCVFHL
ncbi:unnamed protein product [Strongylus vulgaris]|uniref:Receptor L-domain domain-containing protein n=1 Tax=Strongylus vulgaris TaxID=40348 RepID=A0A3P7J8J8_STRVU|nr:unnamed protein product [Strongylus vulgaris]